MNTPNHCSDDTINALVDGEPLAGPRFSDAEWDLIRFALATAIQHERQASLNLPQFAAADARQRAGDFRAVLRKIQQRFDR